MTIDARTIHKSAQRPRPAKNNNGRWVLAGLAVLAMGSTLWAIRGVTGKPASPTSSAAVSSAASLSSGVANTPAPIGQEPSDPYRRADEPQMFSQWGAAGVARINQLRIAAAELVSHNPACDRVELADLADDRSKARHTPVVYVDCANTQRFYITKADLGHATMSETEKGGRWTRTDAIDICTGAVQARLSIPTSMQRNGFNTSAFQAQTTGRWVVDFTFSARNRLGLKLPAAAHCTVMTDGRPEVRIGLR